MRKRTSDLLAGMTSIITAVVFYWEGRGLSVHSNLFPQVLEAFLLICGILLVVKAFQHSGADTVDEEKLVYSSVAMIVAATLIYVFAMVYIGFYVSTAVFLVLMSWVFADGGMSVRNLGFSAVFGIVMTVAIYLTFWVFLQVPTPEGLLF